MSKYQEGRLRSRRAAFTLVELLVVIAIIAILISILVPTISAARRQARFVKCKANMRSIAQGIINYAAESRGKFPTNGESPTPQYWCDDRIATYLPGTAAIANGYGGGCLVCPEDEGSKRSYSMNIFASSWVDGLLTNVGPKSLWGTAQKRSDSEMLLVVETWAWKGNASLGYYYTVPYAGYTSPTEAKRFGANGGMLPGPAFGRFGSQLTELAYSRHRSEGKNQDLTVAPDGRLNFAYLDGHVSDHASTDLANFALGEATGNSVWTTADPSSAQ